MRENLLLGAFTVRTDNADLARAWSGSSTAFPRLKERLNQPAGTLSGGEQQMLAMGRALMSQPQLLLLDEPSMGLSPILVQQIFDIIQEINAGRHQHPAGGAERLHGAVDRLAAYVLETGHVVLSGPAAELQKDPKVRAAYLGDVVEV